ncbi:MFS transporter [Streptomyces sp. NPDC005227]|uniref:MFS transporter n=1 Tax=Streptomyces sp. NPDC005227 TaxID=3364707 RepID=UPI0036A6E6D8
MTSTASNGRLPGHVTAIAVTFLVSCLGDGLAITALMLDFHDRATGGFGIAALFAAMSVPAILLAGLAGRLSDRYPARQVLAPVGIALVAVCALMSLVHTVALLVTLFAVLSALMAVATPVFVKAVLNASPGPLMSRAGARISMASSLGFLIGPAVGAVLMDAVGLRGVLLADAATYLAVPIVALVVPAPSPPETEGASAGQKEGSGLLPGLRTLFQQAPVAQVVLIGAVLTFTLQVTNVVEVYLVRDAYGATATVFGLVTMAWAGGQIIGSGAAGRRLSERPTAPLATLMTVIVGSALVIIAFFDSLPGLFALTVVAGTANGAFGVARQTAIGRAVAPASRGSAAAAHAALLNTATMVALMSAGLVAAIATPRTVYAIAGTIVLLGAIAVHLYGRTGDLQAGGATPAVPARADTPATARPTD